MVENLESLVSRFFSTVGIVESAGYRTIEVLLDEEMKSYFGAREHLRLAFSPEAAHENTDAELVTFGSSFLDELAGAATLRGDAIHLYLNGLIPTTGRTLEKVRGQTRVPGHLLEVGKEETWLFHHSLFRFKVSLIGEEREESFRDIAVDLHTGWSTSNIEGQSLRIYTSGEKVIGKEMDLSLSLGKAYETAKEKLIKEMSPEVKISLEGLKAACKAEQKQVNEHYEKLMVRIEAEKTHKGADPEHLDARARATRADLELRLQDLEKRYRLGMEIKLIQLALLSYLKAVVPLRLQQGKEIRSGMAIWDSLTRQGYIAQL